MSRTRTVLATAGAATAVVALISTAAVPAAEAAKAKKGYTVTVGSNKKGTYTATGQTTGSSPQIKFVDGSITLSCASGTATTSVKAGKNKTGQGLATVTATTFNNCTGPAGLVLTVTQNGTWSLDSTATVAAGADVPGTITNVSAHVQNNGGPTCSFDVTGSVGATFSQSANPQTLAVGGSQASNLTVSNASGCLNGVHNGDHPTFTANYAITSPSGAIGIVGGV